MKIFSLFFCISIYIPFASFAQKIVADSVAFKAYIDTINQHITTDTSCQYCYQQLDKISTADAVKNFPERVSFTYRRVEDCLRNKYDLFHTVPLIERLGKLAKENNSDHLLAWYLNMTGTMMFNANQSDSVLPILLRSMELFEKIKTSRDGLSLTCEFLGGVYWTIKDSAKCIYYHKKSLEYAEGNRWLKFIMLGNISVYYTRVKQFDSARHYTLLTIQEDSLHHHVSGLPYITLLRIDFNSGANLNQLEEDFQKGITDIGKSKNHNGYRYAYITYAKILLAHKSYSRALLLLQSSEPYFAKCDDCLDQYVDLYRTYSILYDTLHSYPLALKYLKLYEDANKKLDEANTQKNIKLAEANYAFAKKREQMHADQAKENAIANERYKAQRNQKYASMAGVLALLIISLLIFRNLRNQRKSGLKIATQKNIIEQEYQKAESLLLNILPKEVAEELKIKGTADAKLFEDVSVIFTDFKNFTKVSERLSPQQLVNELHECFKGFDAIMEKNNIEKIKTVGDAYLAVSGLPIANPLHALYAVKAALEIREFMHNRMLELQKTQQEYFEVKIGIHSGHVVAGIVGVKKFAYDIWGDTVNTAARMEQHSEAGKINISEATFALVKEKFQCAYRGEIEAKNKGNLKMYFVE